MLPLLFLLQFGLQQGGGPAPVTRHDTLRLRIDSATHLFLREWRKNWQETQSALPLIPPGYNSLDTVRRSQFMHCHFTTTSPREVVSGDVRKRLITGSMTAHAMCPLWLPPNARVPDDERRGIDGGIARNRRERIQQLRRTLRLLLDSTSREIPNDVALTGQRIRFAFDANDLDAASAAAAECAGAASSCALLRALVLHRRGLVAAADSAFLAATREMSELDRCSWSDVSMLLEPEQRTRYLGLSCAQRAEFEARLWWLADPLWLERGNERRAEHLARKVHASLVGALGDDERLRFTPRKGGEAVMETLVRYGWPTQFFWGGVVHDMGHDEWLRRAGAETARPYAALEYSRGRVHTVPSPAALDNPLTAAADAWELGAPKKGEWWPREHYARDASRLVQLPIGQSVLLRRKQGARFAWAGDLDAKALARSESDSVTGTLFESRSSDSVTARGTFHALAGRALVVDVVLHPGATLLGVELPGDSSHAAARTRFGLEVAPALGALGGTRALSQPLFFEPADGAARDMTDDAAIARMFGGTSFDRRQRLGLYWESYGFAPGDSVDIEVHVSREDKPGVFERVASVLRIGARGGSEVGMRWREGPGHNRGVPLRGEGVPVEMRSIVLEVSRLVKGTYRFQVAMNRPGEPPVTSERVVALR